MGRSPLSVEDRFWSKVWFPPCEDNCWLWTSTRSGTGYGRFWLNKRQHAAHRMAYELSIGPIPAGLTIDHLCRTRNCVNPAHMEPVTHRINTLRGTGPSALAAKATHCAQGHPFDYQNTVVRQGYRRCRTCERLHSRRQREARDA